MLNKIGLRLPLGLRSPTDNMLPTPPVPILEQNPSVQPELTVPQHLVPSPTQFSHEVGFSPTLVEHTASDIDEEPLVKDNLDSLQVPFASLDLSLPVCDDFALDRRSNATLELVRLSSANPKHDRPSGLSRADIFASLHEFSEQFTLPTMALPPVELPPIELPLSLPSQQLVVLEPPLEPPPPRRRGRPHKNYLS